jgi:hypothetical protein
MQIYIGVPVYGQPEIEFVSSLSKLKSVFSAVGYDVEVDFNTGCSVISKARNDIVKRFMDSRFDYLLFIDSDIQFDALDVMTLITSGFDFCGIPYRVKSDTVKFNCVLNGINEGNWLGADRIGSGMIALSRACINLMIGSYPETEYVDSGQIKHALFDFEIYNREYWGEDYCFCRRWKAISGDIWALPAEIGHVGKKIFSGKIGE